MASEKHVAVYRQMRQQPLWRLLAADNGPVVVGLLQGLLLTGDRSLPGSVLIERLGHELESLRSRGEPLPQTPQAYVAAWLAEGWLERRLPVGAPEETYELSVAAADAIRFVSAQATPHSAATESRLSLVIHALVSLADDTDPDRERRLARLSAERERLDRQIEAARSGDLPTLSEASALERAREIIALADGLTGDFRRVRDQFEQLNRSLRERIVEGEGQRGEVLEALFAGIDVIAESDAGRSFTAFWRLLTNPEQSASLDTALESVMARGFTAGLGMAERRFLLRLTRELLAQGGSVHEVLQSFARSLRHFVQSRQYLEQRRVNQLLQQAQRSALTLKEQMRATESLAFTLELTSARVGSLAQWVLYDPSLQAAPALMQEGDAPEVGLDAIGELVAHSEIDLRGLQGDIRAWLGRHAQGSIAELLAQYPARQGLGSVVGLLALGARHGVRTDGVETVSWVGDDARPRSARIPCIYFTRDCLHALA
ncbi:MAG: DUF3375 domain-containing protein [Burkholderiaceae bacterium]